MWCACLYEFRGENPQKDADTCPTTLLNQIGWIEIKLFSRNNPKGTQKDHLEVRKWGVKGPPILCSKIGLPWDILENLWSKILGALNPPFSHFQMILLGHINVTTELFLEKIFISIHPIWLNSAQGQRAL